MKRIPRRARLVLLLVLVVAVIAAAILLQGSKHPRLYGDEGGISRCSMAAFSNKPEVEVIGCMIPVPGGEMTMGAQATDPKGKSYDPDAAPDEGPPHPVRLSPFFIHREEVTAGQFQRCVTAGQCKKGDLLEGGGGGLNFGDHNRTMHPMNGVSWQGAHDYCAFIGGHLPSEAQWEMAARGTEGFRYPWGQDPASCDYAFMRDGTGPGCGRGSTVQVNDHPGLYRKNPVSHGETERYHLRHMAGNVWEWVADWYAADYYAHSPVDNPPGPATGTRRVQRGGGFDDEAPADLRGSSRGALDPTTRVEDLGFRCVSDHAGEP